MARSHRRPARVRHEAHRREIQLRRGLRRTQPDRRAGVVIVGSTHAKGRALHQHAVKRERVGTLLHASKLDEGELFLLVEVDVEHGFARGVRHRALDGGERSAEKRADGDVARHVG